MNKKGAYIEHLDTVLTVMLVTLFLIVIITLLIVGLPPLSYSLSQASSALIDATDEPNITQAANNTIGAIDRAQSNNVQWISYSLIIISLLGLVMSAFMIRSYPYFALIWLLGVIILIVISIFISHTYSTVVDTVGGDIPAYQQWAANDFIGRNLPMILLGELFVGGFLLFLLHSRQSEESVAL